MARLGQAPMELRSFEITDVDVFLHLQGGAVLRVEISSLPARAQPSPLPAGEGPGVRESLQPETTQAQAPEPVKASKARPRTHRSPSGKR
jgi:hypothetical protein